MFDQLAQQYPKAFGAYTAILAGGEWLRRLLICALVIIIAQILAGLFWLLFTPDPDSVVVAEPANIALSNVASQGGVAIDMAALQKVAVFGVPNSDGEAVVEPEPEVNNIEAQAVDTKLKLTLKGVMQGGDEDTGGAIIDSGKKQQFYSVGEMLEVRGRVKLAKVLENRVILENSGRYESLWLYDGKWRSSSDSSANEFLPGANTRTASRVGSSQLDEARQDIASRGIKAINDLINFRIHRRGGQMLGYRISPGKNPALFKELGLKSGDIVTSVNGVELNAVSNSLQVMKDLRTATSAELMVMRGSEEVAISVNVE